ncbi:MAG TPA: serine hydrolase, partial [Ignavibacteria bacterium]|nr:serine hydrolase [Ignavibacteria bacterium]HRJ86113.1 serine hydrolase [Ignavibacteria bacterium]
FRHNPYSKYWHSLFARIINKIETGKMPRFFKTSLCLFAALLLFVLSHQVHSQEKVQKIDELILKYNALGQFNGAVLVAEDGKIILSKGYGMQDFENSIPNNSETKFRLASVTKQFTAMLIMQLAEKGKIKLEGKLTDYLPYYRKDTGDKITISQILSHTSGLANYTENRKFMQEESGAKVTPKDFVLKYCSEDLIFEPGTKWEYSNSGYFILGLVIEEVTGRSWEENLQENILIPVGMNSSGNEHSDKLYENMAKGYTRLLGDFQPAKFLEMTVPYSAGSMYSTAEDMFKWDQALYSDKLLSNEYKEKMFTPVLNNYGYGWQIIEQPIGDKKLKVVTHSGGIFGFNSLETRLVDDNKFIMVLNNFEGGNLNHLTLGIVNILYGIEPANPKKSSAEELSRAITESGINAAIIEFAKIRDNKDEFVTREREMNMLGYNLLAAGKITEAVEVFKLNVELYPESSNVYDSYGEALAEAGDIENAILNYKRSIELNPDNEGGKQMLEKLQNKK